MRCPKCHNENKIDALTCDFCMATLPMTKERAEQIKIMKRNERKSKMQNSITKLIGLGIGLLIIVGIVFVAFLLKK